VAVDKVTIHLLPCGDPRSRREVAVDKDILDTLDYTHEWLFTNAHGGPVRYSKFRDIWDRAVAKGELTGNPTPHWLRHTCGSWFLNAGEPILTVSRILGHESITTTGIYGWDDKKRHQAAAKKMARLLKG
jgi:integrase